MTIPLAIVLTLNLTTTDLGDPRLVPLPPESATPGAAASEGRAPWLQNQAPIEVDYLVITSEQLAPVFARLIAAKEGRGLAATIVTVEEIKAAGFGGRDLAESIRMFLQGVWREWGLKYLLLGGDVDVVPTRIILPGFDGGLNLPSASDLYFAALDGDWDADGDGEFAEYEDDVPDRIPELALGRAPVSDVEEANIFVSKTLDYQAATGHRARDAILFQSEVFEGLDVGRYSERIVTTLVDGSAARLRIAREYEAFDEHLGSSPLNGASALNSWARGRQSVVCHLGGGATLALSTADSLVYRDDMDQLNGPASYVFMTIGSNASRFEYDDCILEHLLLNPNGGAVATLSYSTYAFATFMLTSIPFFLEEVYVRKERKVGDAIRNVIIQLAERGGWRSWLEAATWVLLGDPELDLGLHFPRTAVLDGERPSAARWSTASDATMLQVPHPNPFTTAVEFSLRLSGPERAVATVYDFTGRRVRRLADREFAPGDHSLRWDGMDELGRPASAGVYVVTVRSGSLHRSQKVVLQR